MLSGRRQPSFSLRGKIIHNVIFPARRPFFPFSRKFRAFSAQTAPVGNRRRFSRFLRFCRTIPPAFRKTSPLHIFYIIRHVIIFTKSYPQFPPSFPQRFSAFIFNGFQSIFIYFPMLKTRSYAVIIPRFTLHNIIICRPVYHNDTFCVLSRQQNAPLLTERGGAVIPMYPDPWWRRHSDQDRLCGPPDTRSSPARRSWPRCRRTTSAGGETA